MPYRILSVGVDPGLLETRQLLLNTHGYDCQISLPSEFEEKLLSNKFDLVILSVALSSEEKRHIRAKLPAGTRPLVLETMVWPQELLGLVSEAMSEPIPSA